MENIPLRITSPFACVAATEPCLFQYGNESLQHVIGIDCDTVKCFHSEQKFITISDSIRINSHSPQMPVNKSAAWIQ